MSMSRLLSRLISSSSFSEQGAIPPSRFLSLRPSSKNPNLTAVYAAGNPAHTPALYTFITSVDTKPNILIFRGDPDPSNAIGNIFLHSLSYTADLLLHGQPVHMKMNQFTGNFTLECPSVGKLKWNINQLTGASLELHDSSGGKLARLKLAGIHGLGGKDLEVLVPSDAFFDDLVVVSGMVAKVLTEDMTNTALEVVQAVAGI